MENEFKITGKVIRGPSLCYDPRGRACSEIVITSRTPWGEAVNLRFYAPGDLAGTLARGDWVRIAGYLGPLGHRNEAVARARSAEKIENPEGVLGPEAR